jgi:hypothetical protein
MKSISLSLLLLWLPIYADDAETDSWKHPEPITYENLKAWHARGGLGGYQWPKEHKVDLNGDGKDEVFLGILGYGRGMEYALFTEQKGKWVLLSDEVDGSHHPIEKIPGKKGAWLDFRALQPTGRGGLFEATWTWNGKNYEMKSTREITAKELKQDPTVKPTEQPDTENPTPQSEEKEKDAEKAQ